MKTDIVLPYEEGRNPDSLQRILVLIGFGYAGLVALPFYIDSKVQKRRARKRKEARERPDAPKPETDAWFENDDEKT